MRRRAAESPGASGARLPEVVDLPGEIARGVEPGVRRVFERAGTVVPKILVLLPGGDAAEFRFDAEDRRCQGRLAALAFATAFDAWAVVIVSPAGVRPHGGGAPEDGVLVLGQARGEVPRVVARFARVTGEALGEFETRDDVARSVERRGEGEGEGEGGKGEAADDRARVMN